MGILKKLFSRGTSDEPQKAVTNTATSAAKEKAEEVTPVARLQARVKDYLDSQGWSYSITSRGDYSFGITIDCDLQRCDLEIVCIDQGIQTFAQAPITIPSERRHAMAELVTRANYGLVDGAFEFDFDTGAIQYSTFLFDTNDTLPLEAVEHSVDTPFLMLKKYGNAIVKTANGIGTPRENVEEAER